VAKRLQVILQDSEYREIQRAARSRHMSLAEWVRQALQSMRREQPVGDVGRKLESVRLATLHEFPAGDMDRMLAEIEAGYRGGKHA
jgi:hypothetical protein